MYKLGSSSGLDRNNGQGRSGPVRPAGYGRISHRLLNHNCPSAETPGNFKLPFRTVSLRRGRLYPIVLQRPRDAGRPLWPKLGEDDRDHIVIIRGRLYLPQKVRTFHLFTSRKRTTGLKRPSIRNSRHEACSLQPQSAPMTWNSSYPTYILLTWKVFVTTLLGLQQFRSSIPLHPRHLAPSNCPAVKWIS